MGDRVVGIDTHRRAGHLQLLHVPLLVGARAAGRLLQILLLPDTLGDGRHDAAGAARAWWHQPRPGRQEVDLSSRPTPTSPYTHPPPTHNRHTTTTHHHTRDEYHTPPHTSHHTQPPHPTHHTTRTLSLPSLEVGTSSLSFSAGVWLVAPATHWRTR